MSITATTNIATTVTGGTGGGNGSPTFIDPITNAIGEGPLIINLSSGVNTITVPTGAIRTWMLLPPSNTQTITLKGVTGDTGIGLKVAGWMQIPVDTSVQTTFDLTTGGAISGVQFWFF